jgi:hypothetical protein
MAAVLFTVEIGKIEFEWVQPWEALAPLSEPQ